MENKVIEVNVQQLSSNYHTQIDLCISSPFKHDIGFIKYGSSYYKISCNNSNDHHSKATIQKLSNPKGSAVMDIVSLTYNDTHLYYVKNKGECHYALCDGFESFSLSNTKQFSGNLSKKYIVKVSCGEGHAVFITLAGMVFVIGKGSKGELGLGTANNEAVGDPAMITQLLNYRILDLFCGRNHNVAIGLIRDVDNKDVSNDLKGNLVFVWGDNSKGQLGFARSKVKMLSCPSELREFDNGGDSLIKCIGGGLYHSYVLFENHALYGFGDNEYDQISDMTKGDVIDKPMKMTIEIVIKNNLEVVNMRTCAYSALLITKQAKIVILGKLSQEPSVLSLNDNAIDLKHQFIITDHRLYVFYSSQNEEIKLYQKGSDTNQIIKQNHHGNNTMDRQNNQSHNNSSSNDFNADRLENELIADITESDFGFSFEQSITELRNYISLVGISLPTSNHTEVINQSSMGFRPDNLPKKTKQEEDYHRHLVEENRRHYINSIKVKQDQARKHRQRIENRKKHNEKLMSIWQKDILPNWFITKDDAKTKRLFYEGLPSNLRGKIWSLCIGNLFSITNDYYNIEVTKGVKLLIELNQANYDSNLQSNEIQNKYNVKVTNRENSIKHIDLDIERTFPELGIFKSNSPMSNDLKEILCAFVVSRPDIGYVQGISYIAAMLLVNLEKFPAFVALINIILNANIIPFYRFDEQSIRKRFQLFKQIFYANLPELCSHFESMDVLPEHYLIEWIMTLFARSLNVDLVARIWDIYMIEGIKTIFQSGIVIFSILERKLLEMDFDDILKTLKSLDLLHIDDDEFAEMLHKVKIPEWINVEIGRLTEENIPI